MPKINLLQAVNSALDTAMDADSSVVCLGEDIGEFGGVFREKHLQTHQYLPLSKPHWNLHPSPYLRRYLLPVTG